MSTEKETIIRQVRDEIVQLTLDETQKRGLKADVREEMDSLLTEIGNFLSEQPNEKKILVAIGLIIGTAIHGGDENKGIDGTN